MRDIGVFTTKSVPIEQLVVFVRSYSMRVGQPFEKRQGESVVGHPPDVLYVSDTTDPTSGYFSDEEREAVELKLVGAAHGYVSIHFTSTDAAYNLANDLAHELSRNWGGIVDYRGTAGELGVPPTRLEQ